MTRSMWFVSVFTAVVLAAPIVGHAHFKLVEPASWIVENERGDPQKSGPCGGSNTDWGKPSYAVTKAVGGSKLHIKLQETIYHPGFYRVALAVNSPNELPSDPVATTKDGERGPISHAFNNPGGYTYHHCADLQIAADKSKPLDTGWPAERTRTN